MNIGNRSSLSILLWIAASTGLAVSIFTLIEEMCLATACSDAASFTFFGVGMGWFGIAYFSLILILLYFRKKNKLLELALSGMVFAGIGAELRLLWIQKYIIGSWCPLCVTICSALFISAMLLFIEKVQTTKSVKKLPWWWLGFVLTMVCTGLAISVVGVRALT